MMMCDMAGQGCEAVASARGNSETSGSSGRSDGAVISWCWLLPGLGQSQSIPGKLGSSVRSWGGAGPGVTRLKQLDSGLSGDYVTAVKNIIWGQAEVTSDVPGMGRAGGAGVCAIVPVCE